MSLISIIVPAYNEERLLAASLRSIQEAARVFHKRGWETELIVCDNNSSDRTSEIARVEGARVVFEPINQIGRARNTGSRVAKGDWLLFVDADSHPSPALFDDVAGAMACGEYVAGGSVLRMDTSSRLAGCVVGLWNWLSRSFGLLAGSFIFCESRVFAELGGFDETLFAGEEIDLSGRLKRHAAPLDKRIVILSAHPLETSSRKVHLYSLREHLRVIAKAVLTGRRSLRDPRHCATWYDGRR
jgi:glycosyltransferase involved in cell wall biosynthesis